MNTELGPQGQEPAPPVGEQIDALFTPSDERAMQDLDLAHIARRVEAEFAGQQAPATVGLIPGKSEQLRDEVEADLAGGVSAAAIERTAQLRDKQRHDAHRALTDALDAPAPEITTGSGGGLAGLVGGKAVQGQVFIESGHLAADETVSPEFRKQAGDASADEAEGILRRSSDKGDA